MIKKISLSLITALLTMFIILPINAFADSSDIDDQISLLSQSELDKLEQERSALAEKTGWNIGIVIIDEPVGKSPMEFSDDYYEEKYGAYTDGVLFMYGLKDSYLSTSGIAINYLNDYRIELLLDDSDKYFSDFKDFEAIESVLKSIDKYYDQGIESDNYTYEGEYAGEDIQARIKQNINTAILIGIIAGLVAGFIGLGVVTAKYKFHAVPSNNNYLNKNSIHFLQSRDDYVRTFTTRTRLSSSSGDGGGGSHGSSTHRSSSGGSHGGGGHSRSR